MLPHSTGTSVSSTDDDDMQQSDMTAVDDTISSQLTSDASEIARNLIKKGRLYSKNGKFEVKMDIRRMRLQIEQLQKELSVERECSLSYRAKLTQVGREKFEHAARLNDEMSQLHNENAVLIAKLEKQAEFTEQLEFELTKEKKASQLIKQNMDTRESRSDGVISELEEQLQTSHTKVSCLESELAAVRKNLETEINMLKQTIDDRDAIISKTCQQQLAIQSERDRLHDYNKKLEASFAGQKDQFQALELEVLRTQENLKQVTRELESKKECVELKTLELEKCQGKCHELAESVEAERAAHLQSKFNGEIVQLKIQDLQNAVDDYKSGNQQLHGTIEKLQSQIRELEVAYSDERKEHKFTLGKLEKCEKEYTLSQRQLQAELGDKRSLVANLKQQLDSHQNNVNDLKLELGRARKRQVYLEETYGGMSRELELIIEGCDTSGSTCAGRAGETKSPSLGWMLDTLRNALALHRQNLESATQELLKTQSNTEMLEKEAGAYKSNLLSTERTLEDTNNLLLKTTKELEQVKSDRNELEMRFGSMKHDLQTTKQECEALHSKCDLLSKEICTTKMKHLKQHEEKTRFLHGLYQRLNANGVKGRTNEVANQALEKHSWNDLTSMVLEQTASIMTELTHVKDRLQVMDQAMAKKEALIDKLKKEHEQELSSIAATIENNGCQWKEERQQLEEHYGKMLEDCQRKQQMTLKEAEDTSEQVRRSHEGIHELELQLNDHRTRIGQLQKHNSSMLCALSMLCGAYSPLMRRNSHLAQQRALLENQLNRFQEFKTQVCVLLQTLTSEESTLQSSANPLLRFRRYALVIIASLRLRRLSRTGRVVFTFTDCYDCLGVMRLGSLRAPRPGGGETLVDAGCVTDAEVLQWLSNKEIIATVLTCTEEITAALRRFAHPEKSARAVSLIPSARASFQKLLAHLDTESDIRTTKCSKERGSLAKQLCRGLHAIVAQSSSKEKLPVLPSQHLLTTLQDQMLSLVKKLHSTELEKKSLKERLQQMSVTTERLERFEQLAHTMELELNIVKGESQRMVPMQNFERVVTELNTTLSREKHAQSILNEQSAQLHDLVRQLDAEKREKIDKEGKLHTINENLREVSSALTKSQEQITQLQKHIKQLEYERTELLGNIDDAENALRTAARDREHIVIFAKNVSQVLEKNRSEIMKGDLSRLIFPNDADLPVESSKGAPSVLAVQQLVSHVTDTLRLVYTNAQCLKRETEAQRAHIARLKEELIAACHRQEGFAAPIPLPEMNRLESTRLLTELENSITQSDASLDKVGYSHIPTRDECGDVFIEPRDTRPVQLQSARYQLTHPHDGNTANKRTVPGHDSNRIRSQKTSHITKKSSTDIRGNKR